MQATPAFYHARRMETPIELTEAADDLEDIARRLFAIRREETGRPSEQPTHQLARSVAYWMITLRRLATSAPAAWASLDEGKESPPEGPAEMVAEVDAMSVFIFGDLVLDDLAYAELVRRDALPAWTPGSDRVPPMWPTLMRELDRTVDPMTADARYLDLTLAPARDVLVAHRDPTTWHMPSFSSWGQVTLARPAVDAGRDAPAFAELRSVNESLEHPWPSTWGFQQLLQTLVAIASRLDADQRKGVKAAYRQAGFESPSLTEILMRARRLLRQHLETVDALASS